MKKIKVFIIVFILFLSASYILFSKYELLELVSTEKYPRTGHYSTASELPDNDNGKLDFPKGEDQDKATPILKPTPVPTLSVHRRSVWIVTPTPTPTITPTPTANEYNQRFDKSYRRALKILNTMISEEKKNV